MIPLDDPRAPKYWMNETSGILIGPLTRYLEEKPLSAGDLEVIAAYCQQWVCSPVWDENPEMDQESKDLLEKLRTGTLQLRTREDVDAWIHDALWIGMDPL